MTAAHLPLTRLVLLAGLLLPLSASPVMAQSPEACAVTIDGQKMTGQVKAGRIGFLKCRACHTLLPSEKNRVGPNLGQIFTRPAASAPGYDYSDTFDSGGYVWSDQSMSEFIEKPAEFAPKTKMIFAGEKDAQKRADLIAYLRTATTAEGGCE